MQMNYLPAGGAVGAGELEVSTVTLYTKQRSAHKRCFIRHYMQDEMKITSNIFWKNVDFLQKSEILQWYKKNRMGFRFWNVQSSTKRSPHPPTIQTPVGGIYLCDVTNTGNQLWSKNKLFVVVLENDFKLCFG